MRVVTWMCTALLLILGGAPLEAWDASDAKESPWRLGPPEAVMANSGIFDPLVNDGSYEIGLELHFAPRRFHFLPESLPELVPAVGLTAGAQGSLYVYAGGRMDLPIAGPWVFSPNAGMGYYHKADGFNLGGELEFRTGIELAYRLPGGSRLGLCLYHLSNSGLFERNPGSESLVLTYSTGLRPGRRRG